MSNIIKFPKEPIERISFDPIPTNKILLQADKLNLEEVVVLGWKGGKIEVLSSTVEVQDILFYIEFAKTIIMNGAVNGQEFPVQITEE